jgi:hypothetical protein
VILCPEMRRIRGDDEGLLSWRSEGQNTRIKPMMRAKPPKYQERAVRTPGGVPDDRTRRELLRQADECEGIAAALAGKLATR